jgi:hypothetical protein
MRGAQNVELETHKPCPVTPSVLPSPLRITRSEEFADSDVLLPTVAGGIPKGETS